MVVFEERPGVTEIHEKPPSSRLALPRTISLAHHFPGDDYDGPPSRCRLRQAVIAVAHRSSGA